MKVLLATDIKFTADRSGKYLPAGKQKRISKLEVDSYSALHICHY